MSDVITPRTIGRNAFWSVLNQSVTQILSLLVFFVTARFISKEAFGVMAVCMLAVELIRQVMIESIGQSLTVKKDPSKEDYNAGFIITLAGSAICILALYFLSGPIAVFMDMPDLASGLKMICLVVLAMALARAQETWMAKNMMFKSFAIRSIFAIAVGGGVGIFMAVQGYGLLSLIVQQILTTGARFLFVWFVCPWRPDFTTTSAHIKSLIAYARHLCVNSLTNVIGQQGDVFFASYYLGAAQTGIYNGSKRLLNATQMVASSAINGVALPVFSDRSDDPAKLRHFHTKATTMTALLTTPLYVGLAFLSHEIIDVLLGASWLPVAPVLSILTVTALIGSLDQYNSNVILVSGKPHWLSIIVIAGTILNIAVMIVMAPYGLNYLALALVIKTIVFFPIKLGIAMHLMKGKISHYCAALFPVITAALFMGGCVHYAQGMMAGLSSLFMLLVLVSLGAVLYMGALFLLDRALAGEIWKLGLHMLPKISKGRP